MWLSLPRLVGVLSPFPILIACASAGAHDANVITAPELSRSKARNAYDAIQQIRPEMLRTRDPGAMVYFKARQPAVAVDYTLVGGVEVLRTLPPGQVARVEYVNSWMAAKRFGTGFGDGVMLIETRADSAPEFAAGPSSSR
ncbi:MAG TPA: hypothetical protein VJ817_07655 [Gemmatimonadales bacterium]|nr:hypothetical protein [Gemmatimonadales bacterium]